MKTKLAVAGLLLLFLALPVFGETFESSYPVACSDLRRAVKDTLSNPANYTVQKSDDKKMTASYKVKHATQITITETILQRTNKVTLVPKATGCETQDVSNHSGVEHDEGAVKKRVNDSLAEFQTPKPSEPAEPTASPK